MASVNMVVLVGRVGKEPEIKALANGNSVANFSVATSETWKDKTSGEKQEKTEWHNITIYGKLADIVGKYVHKGDMLYLRGKLQTRKWTDKAGVDRYTTDVVCDDMTMLGGKKPQGDSATESSTAAVPAGAAGKDLDEDIPF